MAVNVSARGGLGLKFGLDADPHQPDKPAFWTYVLLAFLVGAVILIAAGIRR